MDRDGRPAFTRWAPLAFTIMFAAAILLRAGTSPIDLLRYAAYVVLAILLPGTLVYRALRGRAHTLVEDLAMGAAVGLVLEVAAWALFSVLDLRGIVWLWPALVVVPFVAVPRLRRVWTNQGYEERAPLAWSWTIAGVVCFFTAYLAMVFIDRNPILPISDATLQYLDLPYQLSLAGEAKHSFPVTLPQVAGDPLYYHWFAYVHMGMTSLVGHIDLPVVALRLAIPALCALAILLTGVVGWRVSRRPAVGAIAAVLFFAIGEFNFTHPVTQPFGTQATFVIWHGMSMIYSWVLLLAVILPIASIVDKRVVMGRGAYAIAALLLLGSSGAKASSLPTLDAALLFTTAVLLLVQRRVPWAVVVALLMTGAAQLFATAVLYRFNSYGVEIGPLQGLEPFWTGSQEGPPSLIVAGVFTAFALNMLLRLAGIVPLLWLRRFRLEPAQWLLLGGAIGGPAIYLVFSQPSYGNQYFTRAGFAFGVILSAWGYVELLDRARLPRYAQVALAAGTLAFGLILSWVQLSNAAPSPATDPFSGLEPMLEWARVLAAIGLVAGAAWWLAGLTVPALRGRGAIVLLTGILAAGAPGLIMDEYKSIQNPNGGAYAVVPLPKSRVDAARWVRDHSNPTDIVATNVHCLGYFGDICDSRTFWLSAYSERSVLVEGWAFAPRMAVNNFAPFWDPERLRVNDEAFTAPTADGLRDLRERYGVRWLVADRQVGEPAAALATLATEVYDNGRVIVYELP